MIVPCTGVPEVGATVQPSGAALSSMADVSHGQPLGT